MVYTKKGFRIIDSEGLGQFLDLLEMFWGYRRYPWDRLWGKKGVSVCWAGPAFCPKVEMGVELLDSDQFKLGVRWTAIMPAAGG
jgi:hypothetical protein